MALNFLRNLAWYPPAETQIPWPAIISAFDRKPVDFKSVLCTYLNVEHCVLAESARALLYKLLVSLKEKDGGKRDEVLIPGYTCYSVAASVAKAGLKIGVYDLDPATLHPDIESVRHAISENTLAVLGQHLFGYQTPMDELKRVTHNNGAYLIEDAAQALGRVDGLNPPGTTGDFGLFSFGRGKPLPVGVGGALVSNNNQNVIDKLKFGTPRNGYKQVAITAATQVVSKPYLYWIPEMLPLGLGETVFDPDFNVEGLPSAMESMMAMSISSLERLNRHRKDIADIYLAKIDPEVQTISSGQATSIIRFPVMVPNTNLTKEMKRIGIRRMYPKAICREKAIEPYLTNNQNPTIGAEEIAEKLFTLPTHMGINETLAIRISNVIMQYAG
jgi:dTDP-4-amino-4,6-dideoxygalactose transaminase